MRAIVSDDTAQIFESAFELAPTGVAVIGMDGRLMRVNRALCQMLGRQTDELVGSTSAPFPHRDDLKVTASSCAHHRITGTLREVRKRYLHPDGEAVRASTIGHTIVGADGEALCIVAHWSGDGLKGT